MDLRKAVGVMLVTLALAGCSSDDDNGPTAQEQCALDDRLWTGTECIDHTEPRMVLEGLNGTLAAHVQHDFTWQLNNGTRGTASAPVHSMANFVIAITDGTVPDNTTNPEETSVGVEIAGAAHQNMPAEHEATFSWDTPGDTVDLWGYMRIEGEHIWQQLSQISVIQPPRTSVTETITIGLDPASGGVTVSDTDVGIQVGDAVQFTNDAPYEYVVSFDCGISDITVAGSGGSSGEIEFYAPQSCNWTASSPLAASGVADPGEATGRIGVSA